MDLIVKKLILSTLTKTWRQQGKRIGFVPTMGALHEGHISLIKTSTKENDKTVVSIFVNPAQFNDPEDLKRYPRNLEKDIKLLETTCCDVVFIPEVEEIYPEPCKLTFDFCYLETIMEGAKRPGHFKGVGQVLSILFEAIQPDRAYFGQKDFQQIAVVKALLNQLSMNMEIISCPTVREEDGLAMSSRNSLLQEEHRKNAPHIYRTLQHAVRLASTMDVDALKQWVIDEINANTFLKTEYFEIVDEITLRPVKTWENNNKKVGCIAVYAGQIRLIDNVIFV